MREAIRRCSRACWRRSAWRRRSASSCGGRSGATSAGRAAAWGAGGGRARGGPRTRPRAPWGQGGRAESRLHGVPVDDIHLHELGGADTLVDLVGAFWLMEQLAVEEVYASPIP